MQDQRRSPRRVGKSMVTDVQGVKSKSMFDAKSD